MEDFTTEQLSRLRDLLVRHCTVEELQIFCADLGEDYQVIVPQSATKSAAAQAIVNHFRQRSRLGELIGRVMPAFPNAVWGDLAGKASASTNTGDSPLAPTLALLFAAPLTYLANGQRMSIDLLDFEGERDLLFSSLTDAGRIVNVKVAAATVPNLQKVTTLGCRALHYSGHGAPDFLAFEGVDGVAHALDNNALSGILAASASPDLRLVFVSACHSRRAGEAFVAAGVPHVVAVKVAEAVLDKAAMRFAEQFYLALLANKTVQQAFQIGCEAVANDAELKEWHVANDEREKFLLLPEDGDHAQTVFEDAPHGPWRPPLTAQNTNIVDKPENFVGRSDDLQQLLARISQHRLVSLSGFGGIGKTTLAREVGRYLHQRGVFADGVWFIEARNTKTPESLRVQMAEQLQMQVPDDTSLFRALRGKRLLFILDNCEDALSSYGAEFRTFLGGLLKASGEVRLLITTRQPVGKVGAVAENVFTVKRLTAKYATQLFLYCVPEAQRESVWQSLATPEARAVLIFLAGHPNAILLAAALLSNLSLNQLAYQIEQRKHEALNDLNIPPDERDALTSMTVSLQISVAHLRARNSDAVQLFGLMGLLPGGALLSDLEAVWGEGWQVLMDDLVRLNLVQQTPINEIYSHFTTFPFVTSFAEGLLEPDAFANFVGRAARHFAEVAESTYNALQHSTATFGDAARILNYKEANMLACFGPKRLVANLPIGTISYYLLQLLMLIDRAQEGVVIGHDGLRACQVLHDKLGEANTQQALGDLNARIDALNAARQNYEAALTLYREIQDRVDEANTLRALGDLNVRTDALDAARQNYEAALTIFREFQSQTGEANTLRALGDLNERTNALNAACQNYEAALSIYHTIKDRLGEAYTLKALGDLNVRTDVLDAARQNYKAALTIFHEIQAPLGEANALKALGDLNVRTAALETARQNYEAALTIFHEIQAPLGEANTLQALGDLNLRTDALDAARQNFEAALPIFREIQARRSEAALYQSLGNLALRQGNPHSAFEHYQSALNIHSEIQDPLGMGADYGYMARAANAANKFLHSAVLCDKALSIHRDIQDYFGSALDLDQQGNALWALELQAPAFAAWWQARAIFRAIRDVRNSARLDRVFVQNEEQMDAEQWQALVADLEADAESIRHGAIEQIRQQLESGPGVAEDGIAGTGE